MNTLTFSPTPYIRSRPGRPALTPVQVLLDRVVKTWSTWQAERAMARLDDDALHDMGLVRSEISRAVRQGRAQR